MNRISGDTCPRCGGGIPNDIAIGAYPGALSRWDNLTEICSECGTEEAMLDFINGGYRDGGASYLNPTNAERPWKVVPEGTN